MLHWSLTIAVTASAKHFSIVDGEEHPVNKNGYIGLACSFGIITLLVRSECEIML